MAICVYIGELQHAVTSNQIHDIGPCRLYQELQRRCITSLVMLNCYTNLWYFRIKYPRSFVTNSSVDNFSSSPHGNLDELDHVERAYLSISHSLCALRRSMATYKQITIKQRSWEEEGSQTKSSCIQYYVYKLI